MENTVIMKFGASWCASCKQVDMFLRDNVSPDYHIQYIDIDENPEIAREFNVRSIPTLLVIKDGKEVASHQGPIRKSDFAWMMK